MTPDEQHDTRGWLGDCPVCGGELDETAVEVWLDGNSTPTRVHSECEGGNDVAI